MARNGRPSPPSIGRRPDRSPRSRRASPDDCPVLRWLPLGSRCKVTAEFAELVVAVRPSPRPCTFHHYLQQGQVLGNLRAFRSNKALPSLMGGPASGHVGEASVGTDVVHRPVQGSGSSPRLSRAGPAKLSTAPETDRTGRAAKPPLLQARRPSGGAPCPPAVSTTAARRHSIRAGCCRRTTAAHRSRQAPAASGPQRADLPTA